MEDKWRSFVEDDFVLFSDIYANKEEMLQYCLKFQEIYGEYHLAFDQFYGINHFCLILKKLTKRKEATKDQLDLFHSYQHGEDIQGLMMTISLIDKLTSKEDYITFPAMGKKRRGQINC